MGNGDHRGRRKSKRAANAARAAWIGDAPRARPSSGLGARPDFGPSGIRTDDVRK
jgi:hypothetical protein